MPVADHPEYPSLSASVCAAHAEASRAFLGDDKTGLEPFLFIKVLTIHLVALCNIFINIFSFLLIYEKLYLCIGKLKKRIWPNAIKKHFAWFRKLDRL